MQVRVRGIHSTAATRILLDEGFDVVDPSEVLAERFDERMSEGAPDVEVGDSDDRRGLRVSGDPDGARRVAEVLGAEGWIWEAGLSEDEVLDVEVVDTLGSGAVVSGGGSEAFLPYGRVDSHVEDGDELRVQVVESSAPWTDGLPVVAAGVTVGGDVGLRRGGSGVEVVGGDEADHVQMQRTLDLVDVDLPEGWTPRFRRDALEMSAAELSEMMEDAVEEARDLEEDVGPGGGDACGTRWLWPGVDGRSRFDDARAEVVHTVDGHHRLKAWSRDASSTVDFVEAAGMAAGELPFEAAVEAFGPREGDRVEILHGKPDGRFVRLGDAEVTSVDGRSLVLERSMSAGGSYDGFGAEKEEGDVARTELRDGERRYVTTYLSEDGDPKGSYVNVCTPVEVFSDAVVYVDLHVDAVRDGSSGDVEVVDERELREAVESGHVEEEAAERARELAQEAADSLD